MKVETVRGGAIQRQSKSVWCAGLSYPTRSSNQTNDTYRRNQMHQLPAMRAKYGRQDLNLRLLNSFKYMIARLDPTWLHETPVHEFVVERLQPLVLRCEPALARDIDDEQRLATVVVHLLRLAVDGDEVDVVEVHRFRISA